MLSCRRSSDYPPLATCNVLCFHLLTTCSCQSLTCPQVGMLLLTSQRPLQPGVYSKGTSISSTEFFKKNRSLTAFCNFRSAGRLSKLQPKHDPKVSDVHDNWKIFFCICILQLADFSFCWVMDHIDICTCSLAYRLFGREFPRIFGLLPPQLSQLLRSWRQLKSIVNTGYYGLLINNYATSHAFLLYLTWILKCAVNGEILKSSIHDWTISREVQLI